MPLEEEHLETYEAFHKGVVRHVSCGICYLDATRDRTRPVFFPAYTVPPQIVVKSNGNFTSKIIISQDITKQKQTKKNEQNKPMMKTFTCMSSFEVSIQRLGRPVTNEREELCATCYTLIWCESTMSRIPCHSSPANCYVRRATLM